MVRCAIVAACLAALCAQAQEKPAPIIPAAEGVKKAEEFIREGKAAPEEFDKATEVIKAGNDALTKGQDETAYCLFEEGVMKLDSLKSRYPGWEPARVAKQIKNTLEVKEKLVATTCTNLEQMKEARFRFMVWQRQVVMLRKLDLIQEQLDRMEKVQDKDDEYIKDMRDVLKR